MKTAPDPQRLALAHALGSIDDAGRLLKRLPDTGGLVDALRRMHKEIAARLEGMPLQETLALSGETKKPSSETTAARAELDWRVAEVEKAHLTAFRQFKQRTKGIQQNGHALPEPVRKLIREALPIYDGELLGPEKREEWRRESRVRAAGIGIFYDPWCTGEFEGEKPREWSGPYLEHDRPWRRRNGKGDPILRFADTYFEARSIAEGGNG
jgi:hypothetical protein